MMEFIAEKIQAVRIEVQYIPGWCTYLCQPINAGVSRPIKKALVDLR